jgi:HlyD family secretion protein
LHQAQVNLEYTTILSPINGVVISRSVDVGQTVAASLQAPTLFVIAEDLGKMEVDASVSEADVGKLSPQMTATFTVDAYPGERFSGTIRQIRNAAQTLQNVVTYTSVIDVANPELKLRPGMTASVTFIYAQRDDVVRVPNAALRFRPAPEVIAQLRAGGDEHGRRNGERPSAGGEAQPTSARRAQRAPHQNEDPSRRTVWVQRDDGSARPVSLRPGVSDGTLTEVVEGDLKPGDLVITDAASSGPAGPGGPVRIGGGTGNRAFRMF